MFAELLQFVRANGPTKITIAESSTGGLKVCVIPPSTNTKVTALAVPLMVEASAEELDAQFGTVLNSYHSKRVELSDQVAATAAILDSAKKNQSNKAVKALQGKPTNDPEQQSDTTAGEESEDSAVTGADSSSAPTKSTETVQPQGTDLSKLFD